MDKFLAALVVLLLVLLVLLLGALLFLITFNNGPAVIFGYKRTTFWPAFATMLWIAVVGVAFLGWSKLFPVMNFNLPLPVQKLA